MLVHTHSENILKTTKSKNPKTSKYLDGCDQNALKLLSEGFFRQDFFKTASTHRDTSILHVFGDVGSPEVPLTLSQI